MAASSNSVNIALKTHSRQAAEKNLPVFPSNQIIRSLICPHC